MDTFLVMAYIGMAYRYGKESGHTYIVMAYIDMAYIGTARSAGTPI